MKATCTSIESVQLTNKESVYRCKFEITDPVAGLALDQYWVTGSINVYTQKANYKVGNSYEVVIDVKG